jgi:hypothetical protein
MFNISLSIFRFISLDHVASHPLIKFTGPDEIFGEKIPAEHLNLNESKLLKIFQNYIHKRIRCDSCNIKPVLGICFTCADCYDFDLCYYCYLRRPELKAHKNTHCLIVEKKTFDPNIFQ